MEPTWYSLPDYLIEEFPRFRSAIEESYFSSLTVSANPYPHVFLGEFVGTVLCGACAEATDDERRRAGRIVDELLVANDDDLASAALTSIVEVLRDEARLREHAWPFLGPIAREWITRLISSREEIA